MIELIEVSKRYGDTPAVNRVTLRIARSELAIIVGESGSGKTTLLKMLNRLIEPDSGEVRIDGSNVRDVDAVALRRRTGYVIQQVGLMPHLTVADNIATVPRLVGWSALEITQRVNELLELVGLAAATYRERYPEELSGGQRQRVGIARALAARPQVMLLDEPFGALDPITRAAQQTELRRIHRELELTSIMVTHDLIEALTLADRIAVMWRGELVQWATPAELMAAPANDYVASLMAMARSHGEQLRAILP